MPRLPETTMTVDCNSIFKAILEPITYTVSFDANGGEVKDAELPNTFDKDYSLTTASRYGYTFDGWYTAKNGGTKVTEDTQMTRAENHCCMFGTARDAVDLFEEIQGVPMADSSYRDAIARYIYLGDREKALQTAERLATERLWVVAGPTQVRPMTFFEDPNLREFLLEPDTLRRIREAAFIDNGNLVRK